MLHGEAIQRPKIEVYSIFGEFQVTRSSVKVKYASTFANPRGVAGHQTLLEQLLPVRERVDASKLKNLQSLLQRDLNDARVANELIPYLNSDQIGFFPGILAVLLPKGYLQQSGSPQPYPSPKTEEDDDGRHTDYDGHWTVHQFRLSSDTPPQCELLPLGQLEIYPDRTEVIVLDGQHRTVAFRFAAGVFNPSEIYQAFYDEVELEAPIESDLPVTLIWFESSEPVEPAMISRRLFVDVNNNAKPVSESRTILLNDRSVTAIATQEFYNYSAQQGFASGQFSLLHGAFDIDTDLAGARLPLMAITAPPIVNSAFQWAFFGTETYDDVSNWRVHRLHQQTNRLRFERLFPNREIYDQIQVSLDEDDGRDVCFAGTDTDRFRDTLRQRYMKVLILVFERWEFLKPHYQACQDTEQWATQEEGATYGEVWAKVFAGGEGLYLNLLDAPETVRANNYRNVMTRIEKKFSEKRRDLLDVEGVKASDADHVYRSIRTKAFQIGYVMAVDYLSAQITEGVYIEAAEHLLQAMNTFTHEQWIRILQNLRPLLVASGTGIDPRAWPTYRNILLRLYDRDKQQIYSEANLEASPDWRVIEVKLNEAAKSLQDTYDEMPPENVIRRLARTAVRESLDLLRQCGLEADWFAQESVEDKAVAYLTKLCGDFFSPEDS